MAKDPAMLWYWGDWNSGTTILNRHLKGCYMDLLHAQFNNGHLSLDEVKTVLGADYDSAWPTLKKKFKIDSDGLYFNGRLDFEKQKRAAYTESRRESRMKSDNDLVKVYLVKDLETGFVKVGSSVDPDRRFAELVYQKSPALSITPAGQRYYDMLFVSDPVERKMEKEIHKHFKSRKMKGEWFDLDDYEIDMLLRTFFHTSIDNKYRTRQRMDNENRNENDIVIQNVTEVEVGASKKFNYTAIQKEYTVSRAEIEEEIFNDFKMMHKFKVDNSEIDIRKLWGRCWDHYSVKPSPPVYGWEWKQKLMIFFNKENENVRPTLKKKTNIDDINLPSYE
jgi:hypothetical protein